MLTTAPTIAPVVDPISRNIPIRRLVMWSRTYAAAEPLDVAITETMLAPIAYWIGTPKRSVSAGTTRMPPPTPTSAPISPATTDTRSIRTMNSKMPVMPGGGSAANLSN